MATNVRHWLLDYLIRVAEEHGNAFWKEPPCKKTVQITQVMLYNGDTWALISDKQYYMHARFSQSALDEFHRHPTIGHKRITGCKGTVASIQFQLKFDRTVNMNGILSLEQSLLLQVTSIHVNGAFGMPTFGDPIWIENNDDLKLWVQGLRHHGTSGNILKQRREQREREQRKRGPEGQTQRSQLPFTDFLQQERAKWKGFDDIAVFKLYAQPPPEDLEALAKLDSSPQGSTSEETAQHPRKSKIKDALASSPPPSPPSQSKFSSQQHSQGSYHPSSSRQQATPLPSSSSDLVHSPPSSPERFVDEQEWPPSSPSPQDHAQLTNLTTKLLPVPQQELAQTRYPTAPPSSHSDNVSPKAACLEIPEPTTSQPYFPSTSQLAPFIPTPPFAQPKYVKPCPEPPPVTPFAGVHLQKKHGKIVFDDDEEAKSTQSSHQGTSAEDPRPPLSSFPTVASQPQLPSEKNLSGSASISRSSVDSSLRAAESFFAPATSQTESSSTEPSPPSHGHLEPPREKPLSSSPPPSSSYHLNKPTSPNSPHHSTKPALPQSPYSSSPPLSPSGHERFIPVINRVVPLPKAVPRFPDVDVILVPDSSQTIKSSQEQQVQDKDKDQNVASRRASDQPSESSTGDHGGEEKSLERSTSPSHSNEEVQVARDTVSSQVGQSALSKGVEESPSITPSKRFDATVGYLHIKDLDKSKVVPVPQINRIDKRAPRHARSNTLLTDHAMRLKRQKKYPKLPHLPGRSPHPRSQRLDEFLHRGRWAVCQPDLITGSAIHSSLAPIQPTVIDDQDQGSMSGDTDETERVDQRPGSAMTNDGEEDGKIVQRQHSVERLDEKMTRACELESVHVKVLSSDEPDGEGPDMAHDTRIEEHEVGLTKEPVDPALEPELDRGDLILPLDTSFPAKSLPDEPAGPDISAVATLGGSSQKVSDFDDVELIFDPPENNPASPLKSQQEVEEHVTMFGYGSQTTTCSSNSKDGDDGDEEAAGSRSQSAFERATNALSRETSRSSRMFIPRSQETDIIPDSQEHLQQPGSDNVAEPEDLAQTTQLSESDGDFTSRSQSTPACLPTPSENLTHNAEIALHSQTAEVRFTAIKGIARSPRSQVQPVASSSRVTLDDLDKLTPSPGRHDLESRHASFVHGKDKQGAALPLPSAEIDNCANSKRKRAVSDTFNRGTQEKRQRHNTPPSPRESIASTILHSPAKTRVQNVLREPRSNPSNGEEKQTTPPRVRFDSPAKTDVASPERVPLRKLLGGFGGNIRQARPSARTASYAELKNMIYRTGVFRELAFVPP